MKIRLGIAGYGNLGKAAAANLVNFPDFELSALFSRRQDINAPCPLYSFEQACSLKGKLDVVLMCGGSSKDLPVQSPFMAQYFNIVDSFDTHAKIPAHLAAVQSVAQKAGTLAAVSVGWDPGLFSLSRLLFGALLPDGTDYTFWGNGVSQGHSDALRRIDGVAAAVQYTVPKPDAVSKARSGARPVLSAAQKHLRECFVVLKQDADKLKIEHTIKTMPDYFEGYDTRVNFISHEEFLKNHTALPHGGFVLRSGQTSKGVNQLLELSIKLDSNPEFTSSIMLAYARAVVRLFGEGKRGCLTVFDIPLSYLSAAERDKLIKELL